MNSIRILFTKFNKSSNFWKSYIYMYLVVSLKWIRMYTSLSKNIALTANIRYRTQTVSVHLYVFLRIFSFMNAYVFLEHYFSLYTEICFSANNYHYQTIAMYPFILTTAFYRKIMFMQIYRNLHKLDSYRDNC